MWYCEVSVNQSELKEIGMNQIYDIKQAAEVLKVHHNTVREWVKQGKLKASRPSRKLLITSEAIAEFMKKTEIKGYENGNTK